MDSNKIYIEYLIKNTTKSKINLVEADKFTYLKFFSWDLEIIDSVGNRYESNLMIKRKPLSEKDFVCLKPKASFVIKYELEMTDFMIRDANNGKLPYQSVEQIKYPLTITLKYDWDGNYIHSRTGKSKSMKNAKFSCKSEKIRLYK